MAQGTFAAAVAEEGGLPSLLWAGDRKQNEPRRMRWELEHTDFQFETECGMIPPAPGDPTEFRTDPDMKLEVLRHGGTKGRVMARRNGPATAADDHQRAGSQPPPGPHAAVSGVGR